MRERGAETIKFLRHSLLILQKKKNWKAFINKYSVYISEIYYYFEGE